MATPLNVIAAAQSLLGCNTTEFWGIYNSLYGTDYEKLDWCAAFLRVVGTRAGIGLYAGRVSSWVPTVRDGYLDVNRYYTTNPLPGDVIFFAWSAPGKTTARDLGSHTGIIVAVNGDNITTIEGNSGGVCRSIARKWSDPAIIGVGRPLYTPAHWYISRGYLSERQMENNALLVWAFFEPLGWTVAAVAGMLANMQSESGINPGAIQGHLENPPQSWAGVGYGLVQWTPGSNIWEKEPQAIDNGNEQCARIQREMVTEPGKYGQWLPTSKYPISSLDYTKLTDPAQAASAFLWNYERPPASITTEPLRRARAQYWAALLQFKPGPPPVPSQPRRKMPLWFYLL